MAFRATRYWRSSGRIGGNGNNTKMDGVNKGWAVKGEFAPIYVVLGMVLVAISIGAHTAKQQLVHSPTVRLNKKKRESLPEVEDPDHVLASAHKFVNKSFLRKVALIQDNHQRPQ